MRIKHTARTRRCKFIDDEAGEEDETGNFVAGNCNSDDETGDKPTAEDIAFIDDSSKESASADEAPVRISRREKRLTSDDIELIKENVGLKKARRTEPGPANRRRISRNSTVYKDSDETDIHSSDEGFVVSDSDSEDDSEEEGGAASDVEENTSEVASSLTGKRVSSETAEGDDIVERLERIEGHVKNIEEYIKNDKFWRADDELQEEDEEEAGSCEGEEAGAPDSAVANPFSIMAPLQNKKSVVPAMFQPGFKTKVAAPAKPTVASKKPAPKKKPGKPVVQYVGPDGHVNPYFINRATGQLSYRKKDGTICAATGVDCIAD